jgi:hypothetical protein
VCDLIIAKEKWFSAMKTIEYIYFWNSLTGTVTHGGPNAVAEATQARNAYAKAGYKVGELLARYVTISATSR